MRLTNAVFGYFLFGGDSAKYLRQDRRIKEARVYEENLLRSKLVSFQEFSDQREEFIRSFKVQKMARVRYYRPLSTSNGHL